MTKVTVPEAARLTRKSTKTIYRWLDTGRVSFEVNKDKQKVIDLSELERIADVRHPNENEESDKRTVETFQNTQLSSIESNYKSQIESLERLLAEKDSRLAEIAREKDARINELSQDKQRLQALLEHRPQTPPPDKPKLGFISSKLSRFGL